jgi:hypothetical protein
MADLNPEFAGLGAPISYGVKTLDLEDSMPFGKHKGELISYLLCQETNYMRWVVDNVDRYQLSKEAMRALCEWENYHDPRNQDPHDFGHMEDDIPW